MADNEIINYTSTSFQDIYDDLVAYMKAQPDSPFTETNTQGGNFKIINQLLSYVTTLISYNLNTAINESYIGTSSLRENILKNIKNLSYTPVRKISSTIGVDIEVTETSANPPYLLKFDSITSATYTFYYVGESFELTQKNSSGNYIVQDIDFINGTLIESTSNDYYIGTGSEFQSFIIEDDDIGNYFRLYTIDDTDIDNPVKTYWDLFDPTQIYTNPGSQYIYRITEVRQGYKIEFFNNKLGRAVAVDEKIGWEYIRSNGAEANNLVNFTWQGDGLNALYNSGVNVGVINTATISISTVDNQIQYSYGGADRESEEDIVFNAPLFYQHQGRATTKSDYIGLALNNTLIEKAQVIPGQLVKNPNSDSFNLGSIFIFAKPDPNYYPLVEFTENDLLLLRQYFLTYSVITMNPIVKNAQYIYLVFNTLLRYTEEKIPSAVSVSNALQQYINVDQNNFGEYLESSRLPEVIDDSDSNISSSITKVEKYTLLNNDSSVNPFVYEIIENEARSGIYVITLPQRLKKKKRDKFAKVPWQFYYTQNDINNGTIVPDSDGKVTNPYYDTMIPSTRIESYNNGTLMNVIWPSNHPFSGAEDSGILNVHNFYEILYGHRDQITETPTWNTSFEGVNSDVDYTISGDDDSPTNNDFILEGLDGNYGDVKIYLGNQSGDTPLDFSSVIEDNDNISITCIIKGDTTVDYVPDTWLTAGPITVNTDLKVTKNFVVGDYQSGNIARIYVDGAISSLADYNPLETGFEYKYGVFKFTNPEDNMMFRIEDYGNEPVTLTPAIAEVVTLNLANFDGYTDWVNLAGAYIDVVTKTVSSTAHHYIWFRVKNPDYGQSGEPEWLGTVPTTTYTTHQIDINDTTTYTVNDLVTAINTKIGLISDLTTVVTSNEIEITCDNTGSLGTNQTNVGTVLNAEVTVDIDGADADVVDNYYIDCIHPTDKDLGSELIYTNGVDADFGEIVVDTKLDIYSKPRDFSQPIYDVFGNLVEGSDLQDGELVNITEINYDFDGLYRLINSNSYNNLSEYIRTDRVKTSNYAEGFTKEMPDYEDSTYSTEILLPGVLESQIDIKHRFIFETEDEDLFLNSMQVLNLQEDDIIVDTEKI